VPVASGISPAPAVEDAPDSAAVLEASATDATSSVALDAAEEEAVEDVDEDDPQPARSDAPKIAASPNDTSLFFLICLSPSFKIVGVSATCLILRWGVPAICLTLQSIFCPFLTSCVIRGKSKVLTDSLVCLR
jgi:hypothetical protein